MADPATGSRSDQTYTEYASLRTEGREPGARRKKLAGYWRAANDMRQSYFSGDPGPQTPSVEDGPGAFPDAAVVRSGNEEMILFPSYARNHVKYQNRTVVATPGREMTEEEYWQREWNQHADVNAVVDVDVRGWIYTPQRGQYTRKQRVVIGLARQLVGLPAPGTSTSNPPSANPSRAPSPTKQQEEDLINLEAENIIRKGQQEEKYASRGAFSERPSQASDQDSVYGNLPDRARSKSTYASSITSLDSDPGGAAAIQKRQSWQHSGKMTATELATANTHLLNRLKPFMANPLAHTPISAFFYNDNASRQQTVFTDAAGHFSVRAALDFVPSHVRVLAGEKLSATEEVVITSPQGVSLISDIDDTIKHSAISLGAREIFRNAFTRELGELAIEGVREWYTTLRDMGVQVHYVSNSPWQMYPVLTSYFKSAGLPRGSFHLKQYSGMLQGIFEPAAERKKGSLEKIMRDFPERTFILCGDSGEADLEVYTEVALAYPGKVLGIFIRDVTTPIQTGYFDPNTSPGRSGGMHARHHSRNKSGDTLSQAKRLSRPQDIRNDDAELQAAIAASMQDMESEARRARRSINPDAPSNGTLLSPRRSSKVFEPPLPRRPPVLRSISRETVSASPEENLIDFSDPAPAEASLERPRSSGKPLPPSHRNESTSSLTPSLSPPPPPKPSGLLQRPPPSDTQHLSPREGRGTQRLPPPRPRKPSSAVMKPSLPSLPTHQPSPLSQVTRQESTKKVPPALPARRNLKGTIAKALPSPGGHRQSEAAAVRKPLSASDRGGSQGVSSTMKSLEDLSLPSVSATTRPPALPLPRREASAYSTTALRRNTDRNSGAWDDDTPPGSPGDGMSKKEFLWQQRWARAKSVLERNGVTLRSWRVGSDAADVCIRLVEMELRRIQKAQKADKGR